jgi:hypothetical protein
MRESISKQGRVRQKSKVKSQIASRELRLLLRVERTLQRARSRRWRVVSIAVSLLMAAPASALACPVCGLVGTSDNTWAYQAMSVMLTLLPLAMIGATVWWLARVYSRASGSG